MNNKDRLTVGIGALAGAAAGVIGMYFCDPDRGSRRRASVRDRATHAGHQIYHSLERSTRDAMNRARGEAFRLVNSARKSSAAGDAVLEARVRARLGHIVSHPHAIDVIAWNGRITLAGAVLEREQAHLVEVVRNIRGVREVRDRLHSHSVAGAIPDLQSGVPRGPKRLQPVPRLWSPGIRLGIGLAGAGLCLLAIKRRGATGWLSGTVGAGMLTSSILNHGLMLADREHGLLIEASERIAAPISELFDFWSNPLNYSRIFEHVIKMEKVPDDLYNWTVSGPGNSCFTWEGRIIESVPNTLIAWTTTPDSEVPNSGVVRFDPLYDGSTRIDLRLVYRPPAGVLGQFAAAIFGADPKQMIARDLRNLKQLFEEGRTKVRGEKIELADVINTGGSRKREARAVANA